MSSYNLNVSQFPPDPDPDPIQPLLNPTILKTIQREQPATTNEWGILQYSSKTDHVVFHPHTIGKIIKLCIGQATQASGEVTKCGEAFAKALGAKYSRVSPKLDKDVEFIEAKNDVLIEMLYSTMLYMLNHSDEMDQVLKSVMEDWTFW